MRPVTRILLVNTSGHPASERLQLRPGIDLSVITTPAYAATYELETDVVVVDDVEDLTAVRKAAIAVYARNPFTRVVSPSELSLQAGGYLRSYFGLPGLGYDQANVMSNKYAMKRAFQRAGLPTADFRLAASLADVPRVADALGWPVVIKPVIGGGAEDIFVVSDATDLAALNESPRSVSLRNSPYPLVVEEFVDIRTEYHCDGVIDGGKTRFLSVAEYFSPVLSSVGGVVGSFTLPQASPESRELTRLHDDVVAALGLADIVTHLEILDTQRGLLVGEIACRPGGGGIPQMIAHQYDVDLWDSFLDVSIGDTDVDLAVPERDDYLIQYMLPRPRGVITRLTPSELLAAVPGVERVELHASVGDASESVVHSATHAGVVLARATSRAAVGTTIEAISAAYTINVQEMSR